VAEISFYHQARPGIVENATRLSWLVQTNIDPREPDAWDDNYLTDITLQPSGQGRTQVSLNPYGNYAFRMLARNEVPQDLVAITILASNSKLFNRLAWVNQPMFHRCRQETADAWHHPSDRKSTHGMSRFRPVAPITWLWHGRWNPPLNLLLVTFRKFLCQIKPVPRRDWFGENFSYLIQYRLKDREGGTNATFVNVTVDDPRQSSVTIADLATFKEYEVAVWSRNSLGEPLIKPQILSGHSGEDCKLTIGLCLQISIHYKFLVWNSTFGCTQRVQGGCEAKFVRNFCLETCWSD